jgi:hypothetical protein
MASLVVSVTSSSSYGGATTPSRPKRRARRLSSTPAFAITTNGICSINGFDSSSRIRMESPLSISLSGVRIASGRSKWRSRITRSASSRVVMLETSKSAPRSAPLTRPATTGSECTT